jgi:multidrug efflux system membrane fusion protein
MAPVTQGSKRLFSFGAAAVLLIAVGVGAYFIADGRAKERRGAQKAERAVGVSVVPVLQETVPVRLRSIGNVEPYSSVSVKARVDGQIVAVNFREGQPVRKGEILFRIDPRPYEAALRQAEANALRDAAARDQARSQERRYQELLEKNFVSKEAYAQIRTNAQTAEATARASQAALENARLNVEYCTIASPLDGYVGKVLLQAGNLVKANDANPLVVINQVKPIYVAFSEPEQALEEIRRRMADGPLAVSVSGKQDGDAARPLAQGGRLVFVDNAVDQTTGTIRLRAQFENADLALWPGQFVNVTLRLYDQNDALVVPSLAVQTGPQGEFVYVVKPDSTVEPRKVKVARIEGDVSILADGVAKGERVVTRGQLGLAPGTKVAVRPEGS